MIKEMGEPDAAVAILETRGQDESILLIRRAEREGDAWSGHWSLPGGRREDEDSDALDTALRELEEECGIRLGREAAATALPPTLARRQVGRYLLVAPFVFRVDCELPTVLDAREAVESLWVPLRVLRDPARHRLAPVPGRPAEALFPGVDLNGVPLWGFTYRLLADWLGLDPKDAAQERAGFDEARALLEFLASEGLTMVEGWTERRAGKVATVEGTIPVARVLQRFSEAPGFQKVSAVEVRPDAVRLVGLAYEEYVIRVR